MSYFDLQKRQPRGQQRHLEQEAPPESTQVVFTMWILHTQSLSTPRTDLTSVTTFSGDES